MWGWEDPRFFTQDGWSGSQESIRHFHISHNAPDLPSQILLNLCFFISPGFYSRPKRNWKQCLCKIWGVGGGGQIRCVMWKMWEWRMNAFNTQRLVIEFPESTPWRGKEMRDLSGLLGFGALRRIGTLFFDAGEVFELRLHIVIFLASHYVGKQHRTTRSKTV